MTFLICKVIQEHLTCYPNNNCLEQKQLPLALAMIKTKYTAESGSIINFFEINQDSNLFSFFDGYFQKFGR